MADNNQQRGIERKNAMKKLRKLIERTTMCLDYMLRLNVFLEEQYEELAGPSVRKVSKGIQFPEVRFYNERRETECSSLNFVCHPAPSPHFHGCRSSSESDIMEPQDRYLRRLMRQMASDIEETVEADEGSSTDDRPSLEEMAEYRPRSSRRRCKGDDWDTEVVISETSLCKKHRT
ncbi:unnamed protein product [Calicophoron daubneyi]|uniref:Uncharacterized protein n=1 Tax=Calicophoron daubneyi TaxID=300641 RepID=A0AAV2TYZ7_CALDB